MPGINGNNGGSFEKAVAWVNVTLVTEDGREVKLHKGIPLLASSDKDTALINALRGAVARGVELKGNVEFTEVSAPEADYSAL